MSIRASDSFILLIGAIEFGCSLCCRRERIFYFGLLLNGSLYNALELEDLPRKRKLLCGKNVYPFAVHRLESDPTL